MTADDKYTAFRLQRDDGTLVVRVGRDGAPEFGPGITEENLWLSVAAVLPPPPAPLDQTITTATGLLVTLPEPGTLWGRT